MANRSDALHNLLQKNPNDARALFGLAAEYEKQEQWEQVVAHLERYLRLVDDQGNAWGRLARAYRELGQPAKAIGAFQRGAEQARRHGHPSMAAEFDEAVDMVD